MAGTLVAVCDADDVSREILAPGSPQLSQVVETFGAGVLRSSGDLDRAALAAEVFRDAEARGKLEAIVHPEVRERWRRWLKAREEDGCPVAAVVIPLLFEGGFEDGWDVVVCISALEAVQMERLIGRGHTDAEARQRIAAQMQVREKERRSDFVLINNTSKGVLRRQMEKLLERIVEKSG